MRLSGGEMGLCGSAMNRVVRPTIGNGSQSRGGFP